MAINEMNNPNQVVQPQQTLQASNSAPQMQFSGNQPSNAFQQGMVNAIKNPSNVSMASINKLGKQYMNRDKNSLKQLYKDFKRNPSSIGFDRLGQMADTFQSYSDNYQLQHGKPSKLVGKLQGLFDIHNEARNTFSNPKNYLPAEEYENPDAYKKYKDLYWQQMLGERFKR